jgi:hypothetical protein
MTENKPIPKIQIRQRGCDEDWSKMPYTNKHQWNWSVGTHNEAIGKCKICGRLERDWELECIDRALGRKKGRSK